MDRKLSNKVKAILLLFLLLLFLALYASSLLPTGEAGEEVTITISKNESLYDTAAQLEDRKIIKSKELFYLYGKFGDHENKLRTGKHTLFMDASYKQLYHDLAMIDKEREGKKLVISEGDTAKKIGEKLQMLGIAKKQEFNKALRSRETLSKDQADKLDFKDGTSSNTPVLEGYLYPGTYYFKAGTRPETIVRQTVDRFLKNTAKLRIKKEKLKDTVILASIIQKEALLDQERPVIAGVFLNRLKKGQKLQSCATVQYLLHKPKARLRIADLKVKSPYNTYLNTGLPPSAISNPGFESLSAAANPAKHNYFYFVAKQDGTGSHYFSTTYEQHQRYTSLSGND